MYIKKPSLIKQFSEKYLKKTGIQKCRILGELIGSILFCEGKRTFEGLSKVFLDIYIRIKHR